MATPSDIANQLERLAAAAEFATSAAGLVEHWKSANVGFEAVEPILRFMEEHPSIDFGTPGALVHFAESFCGIDYEAKLLESISRKPTCHTVWMLNRLINGSDVVATKRRLIAALARAQSNPLADTNTLNQISRFLERFGINRT